MALLAGFVGVRLTRRLGQVSYSGYLMHVPLIPLAVWLVGFAVLHVPFNALLKERRFVALSLPRQVALTAALGLLIVAYAGAQIDFIYFAF